ncbi:MAG: glutamyl-tRNA amidotransferase [Verrucomicrobiales bacterium]|nr:glutamyl-tRNA amidotransferase [Verrucomicrobiales bacterium]|tara:strand:- start:1982 stop:2428 length:447 start_codon:yes stop_codon:yes gene_type:complete
MSLLDRINADIKEAMKARDSLRLSVLRMLKSAIDYAAIEKKTDSLPDDAIVQVIQKEAKKRQDSIAQYESAGRADAAAQESDEQKILQNYLPKQLSADELESLVKDAIAEAGATSRKAMGQVMKIAVAKAAGRADGKSISALAGKLLS